MKKMADGGEVSPFKFVSEEPTHFLVENDQGQVAPIAKSGLSDSHMEEIRGLPTKSKLDPSIQAALIPQDNFSQFSEQRSAHSSPPTLAPEIQTALAPEPKKPLNPVIQQGLYDSAAPAPKPSLTEQGYNQMIGGIQGAANAQAKGQELAAQAAQQYQADLKKVQDDFGKQRMALDEENKRLEDDYKKGAIDPNHFWNQKTGFKGGAQKVLSFLGLFLGGVGSIKGAGNPAQQMLQKAIEDDIDAQKVDLNKKQNLLKMNLEKYGDLRLAEQATKLDMMNMFNVQLQGFAAQTNSQVAKQNAAAQIGQINIQRGQIADQLAKEKVLKDMLNAPTGVPDAAVGMLPQEYQERAVRVGDNKNVFARSKEDAAALKESEPAIQNALSLIDETIDGLRGYKVSPTGEKIPVEELGTALGGDIPLLKHLPGAGEAGLHRQAQIINALREVGKPLKISEYTDENLVKKIVPNPARWQRGEALEMFMSLKKELMNRIDEARSSRLMSYNPSGSNAKFTKGLAR